MTLGSGHKLKALPALTGAAAATAFPAPANDEKKELSARVHDARALMADHCRKSARSTLCKDETQVRLDTSYGYGSTVEQRLPWTLHHGGKCSNVKAGNEHCIRFVRVLL
jgi:hypothetical protein